VSNNNSSPTRIAFVGEIDHGKSTLIGRLLLDTHSLAEDKWKDAQRVAKDLGQDACMAFLTDQLKEEREQSLTIDTTEIFLKTHKRHYILIDNPGHREFIKNMMTGTSQAEAALLVTDISRGIEEQTRRHVYVIRMFGLESLIVAVNKMDLIKYDETKFRYFAMELAKLLTELGIDSFQAIPVSALEGINIQKKSKKTNWFKGPTLTEAMDTLKIGHHTPGQPLRFPVQDVYCDDIEDIVVGRISTGTIRKGKKIIVLPDLREAIVKDIKVFLKKKRSAQAGESIGLTLSPLQDIKRGDILCELKDHPSPTRHFSARIFWLAQIPLIKGKPLTLRLSTQEIQCTIKNIDERIDSSTFKIIEKNADELNANDVGLASIESSTPLIVEPFEHNAELGRFVLEDPEQILGVGIVTEIK
jgi:bifunctional enzyme CysN/CysC/sulfate adenylyltransferase subunit 1